jgi:hypothetical protein
MALKMALKKIYDILGGHATVPKPRGRRGIIRINVDYSTLFINGGHTDMVAEVEEKEQFIDERGNSWSMIKVLRISGGYDYIKAQVEEEIPEIVLTNSITWVREAL